MAPIVVWKIMMRRGMNVTFACGHRQGRKAAFLCLQAEERSIFVRRVPRPQAAEHPCHACVLKALGSRPPDSLAGFQGLVKLDDAAERKDRLN
jgi:hypothetical protein